jgi:hypothetical protein
MAVCDEHVFSVTMLALQSGNDFVDLATQQLHILLLLPMLSPLPLLLLLHLVLQHLRTSTPIPHCRSKLHIYI